MKTKSILDTLNTIRKVVCINANCDCFSKCYDVVADSLSNLHLTLDDMLASPTHELNLLPCHHCDEHGDLVLHERFVYDTIVADNPHNFLFFLNLSETLLENLILLVKNLQEDKVAVRRIVPASFAAIKCDDAFFMSKQMVVDDPQTGCWSIAFDELYDQRNKTLEVFTYGVRFLVDLTPKNDPQATPIHVASNVYQLHQLLELQEFVRVNLSDQSAADLEDENDSDDVASE